MECKEKEALEEENERRYNLDMMEKHGPIPASPVCPSSQGTLSLDKLCPACKGTDCTEEYFTTCEVRNIPEGRKVCTAFW